jgi:hypothetical protein
MSLSSTPQKREHHFYVSIAKFLFYHPEHGIVSVGDPVRRIDAERHGLSPLILYGLTVAGLPIRWMTFAPIIKPKAFREVLLDAWTKAEGLRGLPDVLRINRHLAKASPTLSADMARIGVRLEIASAKEKSLPASLRSAQEAGKWLPRKHELDDASLAQAVQTLCRDAQDDHNYNARGGAHGLSNRQLEGQIKQWLALPTRQPGTIPTEGRDWEPGPWLSSWETALPPEQPRYFNRSSFDGRIWLLSGQEVSDAPVEDDDFSTGYDHDNAADLAKDLLACWPNPSAEIAKSVGITLRNLQWFVAGKVALDRTVRFRLEDVLGIEFDEGVGGYTATGSYVLIARKPQAVEKIYEEISGGGDACPCEIVPSQGPADPSWRYVLINAFGKPPTFVMAPRGEKIAERLGDLMINYEGIRAVSPVLFRDVVSTCARACREPAANVREMRDFAKRYEEQWIDCMWRPE